MNTLLCFGIGYCAQALAQLLKGQDGWRIAGTSRTNEGAEAIARKGFEAIVFDGETASAALSTAISQTSHVLISAPPGSNGDPVSVSYTHLTLPTKRIV